jgi:hypothetical protein
MFGNRGGFVRNFRRVRAGRGIRFGFRRYLGSAGGIQMLFGSASMAEDIVISQKDSAFLTKLSAHLWHSSAHRFYQILSQIKSADDVKKCAREGRIF